MSMSFWERLEFLPNCKNVGSRRFVMAIEQVKSYEL
jgi:hypothetical protein